MSCVSNGARVARRPGEAARARDRTPGCGPERQSSRSGSVFHLAVCSARDLPTIGLEELYVTHPTPPRFRPERSMRRSARQIHDTTLPVTAALAASTTRA